MNTTLTGTYSPSQVEAEQRSFITRVYGWMTLALIVTGMVSMYVAGSPGLIRAVIGNRMLFFGLIIGELALVGVLVGAVSRMSALTATAVFLGYAALNGLTMATIFLVYTASSIATTFFITAGTFAAMSIYGFTTKRDLTGMGGLATMGLIGIVIASLVNFFLHSTALYWLITYVGIAVFVGLIAYDTQKLKAMNVIGNEGTDEDRKEAVVGALVLYLDFINLFLMLLRLFGQRRWND